MSFLEANLLADTFQKTRDITRWYISSMKEIDPLWVPVIEGKKFNTLYWQVAHLTWAEQSLIVRCTGGEQLDHKWLAHYKIGSDGSMHPDAPDFKTLLHVMKEVHEHCMNHLLTIDDERMAQLNPVNFGFGEDKTNRIAIQHAIRHEGIHTGQLAWMCKMKGVKMV